MAMIKMKRTPKEMVKKTKLERVPTTTPTLRKVARIRTPTKSAYYPKRRSAAKVQTLQILMEKTGETTVLKKKIMNRSSAGSSCGPLWILVSGGLRRRRY